MLNLFQYYLFLNFNNHFNKSETVKLTVAPRAAKTNVFKIATENKLGKILNNVPEVVLLPCAKIFSPINNKIFSIKNTVKKSPKNRKMQIFLRGNLHNNQVTKLNL